MKKLGVLFAMVMMLMVFAMSASALEPTGQCGDNVYYTYDSATGEVIISGEGKMTDYDYYSSDSPFYRSDITSVVIEDGVTNIGRCVFEYCADLTSVTIPDSVTSIGCMAFEYCTSLINPVIPESVKKIGEMAFRGCSAITSVTIPDSVRKIGRMAFSHCDLLTEVMISDRITDIGESAFAGKSLQNIYVDEGNTYFTSVDGVLFDKDKTKILIFPQGKDCTAYTIPYGVKIVGDDAFYRCENLESVMIPDSVTNIGYEAFVGCSNLKSITVPNGVSSIGPMAFWQCSRLADITFPDSVKSIGYYVCEFTAYKNDISNWENDVLYINNHLIDAKESIDSCEIKEGTLTIGDYAFMGCRNLKSMAIPDSVTSIGDWAFDDCTMLSDITMSENIENIGCYSFNGVAYSTNTENWIGDYLYLGNALIQIKDKIYSEIYIPANISVIADNVIYEQFFSVEKIVVDENNKNYSSDEYGVLFNKNKTKLLAYPVLSENKEYAIPEGVKEISGLFFGSFNLNKLTIPESVEIIPEYCFFFESFNFNTALTDVYIYNDNLNLEGTYLGLTYYGYLPDTESFFKQLFEKNKSYLEGNITDEEYYEYLAYMESQIVVYGMSVDYEAVPYGITIHANSGSNIETYAEVNDIDFKDINNEDDSVTDKDDSDTDECECICHDDGIFGLIYKIIALVQHFTKVDLLSKIFHIGQVCDCGIAHY